MIRSKVSNTEDESILPFGMTWDRAAFKRVRTLAMNMFGAFEATIVLVRDGKVYRSIDPHNKLTQRDNASALVIDEGKALWIEDMQLSPIMRDNAMIAGPPYLRTYAGVPIRLPDGTVLGAFCAVFCEPKAEDRNIVAGLESLAEFIADECDRARADEALAQGVQELRSTRTMLAALVEVIPVSLMMLDTDMRVITASKQWLSEMDLTAETGVGRSVYDLQPGYELYRASYDQVLAGETIRAGRVRWPRPDGTDGWLRTELTPWYDDEGKIGGLISVALDVTDTIVALRRSERAEQRMNLACEMTNLHVWELDYEKRELLLAGLTEQTQQEIFGRTLTYDDLYGAGHSTVHPEDRDAISAEWEKAVDEDRKFIPEYRIARQDDQEIWAASSVQLVRDRHGKPRGLIGAMQNITARKQAEIALIHAKDEAETATRAKSAFLATMSHEIRTPLNGVLGMAQAMAADELDDVQRDRLSIIRQSGETLLAILNDVLDISKIEAGKLELELDDFDIKDVAHGAHAAFTELANRKGLSFNLVIEEPARGLYRGDSTRLRQILYNLISNAVKFTEQGEVLVTVSRPEEILRICISDTGVGVPADRLPRLFGKFEQADASTTRRYGGTGLGLAICRDLAQLMGGTITASSTPGEGSVFEVMLPLERLGEGLGGTVAEPSHDQPAGRRSDASDLRVLAAEDNAVNQLVLRTLLHQAGVDPVIVANGVQAVEAWRNGQWDLILMDVQMPEMDGLAATRAIRAEEALTGRPPTPIIALTANAMAHQVAEYRACGMDDFVAKPIEITQLFAAVERVLEEAEAEPRVLAS